MVAKVVFLPVHRLHIETAEDDPAGTPEHGKVERLRTGIPVEMNNAGLRTDARSVVPYDSVESEAVCRFLVLRPEFPVELFADFFMVDFPPLLVARIEVSRPRCDSPCVVDCDGWVVSESFDVDCACAWAGCDDGAGAFGKGRGASFASRSSATPMSCRNCTRLSRTSMISRGLRLPSKDEWNRCRTRIRVTEHLR